MRTGATAPLRRWPVRAEVGVGMLLRPPVKNLGERDGLSASRGQVPLQHKHEHDVAFGGEVCDILGHDRPAFATGERSHVRVFGSSKTDLGDMDRIMTVGVAQEYRGSCRKRLIDQKGGHASNAS